MLNLTKAVSRLVMRTSQQIDTKLMHSSEKFGKNILVTFSLLRIVTSSYTPTETEKTLFWSL